MTRPSSDPFDCAQRELASWHSTHPRATFAELEAAVEEQIATLRAHLLTDRTTATMREEQPLCRECGATMRAKGTHTKQVIIRDDEVLTLDRSYVVCPQCGAGLFPPG